MLGIILGTLCLIGLIKVLRRGRRGYGGYGGWGGGGCSRGWGHHRGGWDHHRDERGGPPWASFRGGFGERASFFMNALFRELDATPGQERVIKSAVEEVREAGRELRGEAKGSRVDVAKAVRADNFDEVLFGEMFHRHDVAMEGFRKSVMGAIAKVHAVLDEKQRARLADLIENGPRFFRGGPWSGERYAV